MTQERVDSGGSKKNTSSSQAPDIKATVASAGNALDKVRVVHGANAGYFELAGKTVGQAKKQLRDVMNIPSDAGASIGPLDVDDDTVLESGMSLEFTKNAGQKGGKRKKKDKEENDDFTEVMIRWLIRRDMDEVLAAERSCFEFPWTEEEFLCVLRQRNCIGTVAEADGKVLGYMIYELHQSKLKLLNFGVHADHHRKKIGTQMINRIKSKLSQQRRTTIELIVRETNLAAQMFFGAQEFRAVQVLRNEYDDTSEDGYRMVYNLNGTENLYSGTNRIKDLFIDHEQ